jgi:hypothetical protein
MCSKAINVTNSEEADPILSVHFKTELASILAEQTHGNIAVNVTPT